MHTAQTGAAYINAHCSRANVIISIFNLQILQTSNQALDLHNIKEHVFFFLQIICNLLYVQDLTWF